MIRYEAGPVLAELKDFQRTTVAHVMERYFGDNPTRRFLVADETGLGKSVVARGVIASLLERLQDDDEIKRVDVVYVCSNQDIAAQNLSRLRVSKDEAITLTSRLTMLGRDSHKFATKAAIGKALNLVAFTPGTSFDKGWRTGKAEERALLHYLLRENSDWDGWRQRAALRALQGTISTPTRFEAVCDRVEESLELHGFDRAIRREFLKIIKRKRLGARFDGLLEEIGRRNALPVDLKDNARECIGELRAALAQAGVQALEPDLVILDEFQRFRHLLDEKAGGESAELAHHLFNYKDARVLLLSATPYKPFTYAEESHAGEDHHADLLALLRFLNQDEVWQSSVSQTFGAYRDALTRGRPAAEARDSLRHLLLDVMCRTERPAVVQQSMLSEHVDTSDRLTAADIRAYVAMREVAKRVEAPMTLEYWKSAPYFLNFLDGYQLGDRVKAALKNEQRRELEPILERAQVLDAKALEAFEEVDLGNSRLRRLAEATVAQDWWRLLWMPPSLPHYQLGGPFADAAASQMTKRLLFSSWNATPTAVASLLSYEVERRLRRQDGATMDVPRPRLDYRLDGGRPAAMSALALFWPHPSLAEMCDPLAIARRNLDGLTSLEAVHAACADALRGATGSEFGPAGHAPDPQAAWQAFFRWSGGLPGGLPTEADAVHNQFAGEDEDRSEGLTGHLRQALEVITGDSHTVLAQPDELLDDLTNLGLHSPGNIAWRAIARVLSPGHAVTQVGQWRAAATIASGLRTLFNRPDSMLLLDQLDPDQVYWRAVLRYCAAGGLQAVLDEYVHTLRSAISDLPLTDDLLFALAKSVREAIALRPSTYAPFNPLDPDQSITIESRFALRYGGAHDGGEPAAVRQSKVRQAFNSPFWPFVVATTSAGQEGIDFHQYCSAVVHWNTPTNPVDFEQREGRVHRFGGHAIRRNVADKHRAEALRSDEPDVWKAAYDAARRESGELGDFSPYWVYPGPAMIERHVLPYPLSKDHLRLARLKEDLALYRLAFGQPRQEDMIELIKRKGTPIEAIAADVVDLRPRPV